MYISTDYNLRDTLNRFAASYYTELALGEVVFTLLSETSPLNKMPKGGFLLYNVLKVFQNSADPQNVFKITPTCRKQMLALLSTMTSYQNFCLNAKVKKCRARVHIHQLFGEHTQPFCHWHMSILFCTGTIVYVLSKKGLWV